MRMKDDFDKIIIGTLHGAKFFEKDYTNNSWLLLADKAQVWHEQLMSKFRPRASNIQG